MEYKLELQEAIEAGDMDKFRRLFEPRDLNCDDYDGSLLHAAASFGTVEIVKFLVENGADLNRNGGTFNAPAITYAAEEDDVDIVRYLVEESGATLDTTRPMRNPLLRAVARGSIEVVEYLLTTGIDPHATYRVPTGKLINAYVEAEQNGRNKVIELLKNHGCRRPVEGEDVPIWEPSQQNMLNHTFGVRGSETPEFQRYQQIIRYMESLFGTADQDGMQELVPVAEGMSVAINVIQPNGEHPYLVLFTNGMSDLPMKVPPGQEAWQYAELVMHLPADWVHPREAGSDPQWLWPIKWLRTMAYLPHLNETWLGRPATIVSSNEAPEPLGPNTEQTCLLMLPDHSTLDPPLQTADGNQVHFYTVVPLFTEERDFERQHGMKEFFKRFSEQKVPLVVDVDRT